MIQNVEIHKNKFRMLNHKGEIRLGYFNLHNALLMYKECSCNKVYQCAKLLKLDEYNNICISNFDSRFNNWKGQDIFVANACFFKVNKNIKQNLYV